MHYKGDSLLDVELIKECIQVAAVFNEGVGAGAAVGQFLRIAHADEIGCNAATKLLYIRNNVAPEVGGGGIAMQKDYRVAASYFYICHALSKDVRILFFVWKCCIYHV